MSVLRNDFDGRRRNGRDSGAREEKKKAHGSFEDLRGELDKQKNLREQLFTQEQQAQKDRSRILEEKFQAAFKRAEDDGDFEKPFKNPLEFD